MRFKTFYLVVLLALVFVINGTIAKLGDDTNHKNKVVEANVWTTEDGKKHFICPVMGREDVVTEKTPYSDVNRRRYYHCCNGCPEKFQANPSKYLENFVIPGNVVKADTEGQNFQCPVSGEMGMVTDNTKYSDVDGKRYYFCCNNCKTKFDTDSEKFLKSEGKKDIHQHEHHKEMKKM